MAVYPAGQFNGVPKSDAVQIAELTAENARLEEKLVDLAERTRQTVTDWEVWAANQDNVPPDDLLEWSRLTLEELDRILKGSE